VCRKDVALPMLIATAPWRVAAADNFIETARPPASSAGVTILEPLESRLRLFCNEALEAARLFAATVAAKLVLMTTDMLIFLDTKRDVRVAVGPGGIGSGSRRPGHLSWRWLISAVVKRNLAKIQKRRGRLSLREVCRYHPGFSVSSLPWPVS